MTDHERLYAVYRTLLESVTGDEGFGGPVYHDATVGKWGLRMASSSWGELSFSARDMETDTYHAFVYVNAEWLPYTKSCDETLLPMLVRLAETAPWVDLIERHR